MMMMITKNEDEGQKQMMMLHTRVIEAPGNTLNESI